MEQDRFKRELEAIAGSLTNSHVMGPTTPQNVQMAVRYASRDRLLVAAVDRFGHEWRPSESEWKGLLHSFYHLKFKEVGGSYPIVGTFIIPQETIGNPSSINECVRRLLLEYPLEGSVVARHSRTFETPTMQGSSMWHLYDVRLLPVNGGYNGFSIKNSGKRVCSLDYHCGMCE